ncbi:methylenetetrahydrofolate reductase [Agrobacterium vitis]|uniref:methylenetetrahydrofolate reductase n=1 Tax=Agrobacterium vitis TaxID=373 RepID=UPI0015748354|nr:methylenetetrahydrofolate reductase [Agrobacterium vitis]NSZ19058.1 methylenetetrahydrofolate reductase [Agrobacterium vitis]QZO06030.1 methylenetetrahydrofolate reductase [Agrobacterium vitis]UJL90352.1 methylenetetrahydrofolate reductase [Agrobacterium vitis]
MMDKAVLTDHREYPADQGNLLDAWSIEVTPRTAAKVASFQALLPAGTRIYIAHVDGTPFEDMVATARRLHEEGFPVMPHIPARSIADVTQLEDLLKQYRDEADVRQALLLAGGIAKPRGTLSSSMQLIETGLFDRLGFTHLHIAGHPEGNRDIDADGSTTQIDAALRWKVDFASRTDAQMAIVTQFAFDATAIIDWAERIAALGIDLPIHVGIAGPAKLQTLIKYAISSGVGPSLKVLQKRALDLRKLLMPYEPTDIVGQLIAYKAENPQSNISNLHLFPLGGIEPAARWIGQYAH